MEYAVLNENRQHRPERGLVHGETLGYQANLQMTPVLNRVNLRSRQSWVRDFLLDPRLHKDKLGLGVCQQGIAWSKHKLG